ncbi:MAG: phosphoribosyltransferase [Haloferacaceae archaeon]
MSGDGDRPFADREDAGRRLGAALAERGIDPDVVLAIPRGGLPLGRAVADALDAPLDVIVARKMGAPHNPEFAIGAAAADGSVHINEAAIERHGVDTEYVERARESAAEEAREKAARYRDGDAVPDLADAAVVIVDDGVATGATARACIAQARAAGAARVVLAVPVGSPRTVSALESVADGVVCPEAPPEFRAVGQFYERFDQVSDEEAMAYLTDG